jgi:hypothetical protein
MLTVDHVMDKSFVMLAKYSAKLKKITFYITPYLPLAVCLFNFILIQYMEALTRKRGQCPL